ncbi:hypothetical protein GTU99_07655 [Streptomyces sp. PRKS01-65]|nr:hypothetical protein [Streptomyces harenosi]NEY32069.1 hypothetical protein [Streptomyces harenosi]
MTDMPAQTVYMLITGPADRTDQAITALKAHGIAAQRSERSPGLVEAWFQPPCWPPTPDFECDALSRATEAVADTEFIALELGWQVTSTWSSYVAVHRQTGEPLGCILDMTQPVPSRAEVLAEWLSRVNVPAEDIEWRSVADLDPEQLRE